MHGHRPDQGTAREQRHLKYHIVTFIKENRPKLDLFFPGKGRVGHDGDHVQRVLFTAFHVSQISVLNTLYLSRDRQ